MAFARSFNTFSCMLLRNSKLANYCIHIAAFWLGATKVNWYGKEREGAEERSNKWQERHP